MTIACWPKFEGLLFYVYLLCECWRFMSTPISVFWLPHLPRRLVFGKRAGHHPCPCKSVCYMTSLFKLRSLPAPIWQLAHNVSIIICWRVQLFLSSPILDHFESYTLCSVQEFSYSFSTKSPPLRRAASTTLGIHSSSLPQGPLSQTINAAGKSLKLPQHTRTLSWWNIRSYK